MGLVQSKQGTASLASGGTLTITLDNPTTAGNGLIVVCATAGSTANPTVGSITLGGSAGNFASRQTAGGTGDTGICAVWDDLNCAGGQTAVAITITGGTGATFAAWATVYERDDLLTASAFDKGTGAVDPGGGTFDSGATATTTAANEVFVGGTIQFGTSTPAITGPSSPWVNLTQVNLAIFGGNQSWLSGYNLVGSVQAADYTGTVTGNSTAGVSIVATFKVTSAGSGTAARAWPPWRPGPLEANPRIPGMPGGEPFALFPQPAGQQTPAAAAVSPVQPNLGHPVQAKTWPTQGGHITARAGVYAQSGPPVRPPDGPVRAQPAVPFLPGRAISRRGTYAQAGPAVRPPDGPVTAARPPANRAFGHTAARTGPLGVTGPPVRPPSGPVQARQLPRRGGAATSRDGTYAQPGPPVRPPQGPVRAQPAKPLLPGRTASRDGTYTQQAATGPPVRPHAGPVRAQPQVPVLTGRITSRPGLPPFRVIQQAQNAGTGTTLTVTLASPTAAGDCLVVLVGTGATTTNGTVSGITLGGSADHFAAEASKGTGSDHAIVTCWTDPNCAGGQTSVVITTTGSVGNQAITAWVYELSGMPAAGPLLDQSANLSSTGFVASWTLGPTPATTQAAEAWFGIAAGNVSATTAGAYTGPSIPWINAANLGVNNYTAGVSFGGVAGYQLVNTTGTASYNGTVSPNSTIEGLVVTLKAAAPPSTPGPPVRPLTAPVRAAWPARVRGGTITRRTGVYAQAGPHVRQPAAPVRATPPLPPRGRIQSRAGTFTSIVPQSGPPVRPPQGPVRIRPSLPPPGAVMAQSGPYGQAGPPVRPAQDPVRVIPQPPPRGRIQARTGTWVNTVITSGPPVYPLHHPVTAPRTLPPRGRTVKSAGVRAQAGPPVRPPSGPVGVARLQPPPPTRGRTATLRGPAGTSGPPAIRLRKPVRGQPQKPLLTGRTASRAGILFTPPFLVARSTSTVTDPRDGTATVADPRDGSPSVTALAISTSTVT